MVEDKLRDGTLVRHKVEGYEGYVEGITRIRALFTERGQPLDDPKSKQSFQYRIVSEGESVRRITPVADIEILEGMVGVARRKQLLKGTSAQKKNVPRKAKGTIIVK